MGAMAHEPSPREEVLLEGFLDLGTPEGFRTELIEEEFVVTGPPDWEHEDYISLIVEQVLAQSATRMQFSGHKGLRAPRGGLYVRNHVTPDGTFAPREQRLFPRPGRTATGRPSATATRTGASRSTSSSTGRRAR